MLGSGSSDHYALLTKLGVKLMNQETGLDMKKDEDRGLVMRTILYCCATVADASKKKPIFDQLFDKMLEEFHRQGDLEGDLGMPVSMFMNRTEGDYGRYHCQLGYINVVCLPLLEVLCEFVRAANRDEDAEGVADLILAQCRANKEEVRILQSQLKKKPRRSLGGFV